MDGRVVWRIGVGKVGRILLLAKAKSSKSFLTLHCRIEGGFVFIESRWNRRIKGNCRICGIVFCGFVDSVGWILQFRVFACEILRNCGIAGCLKLVRGEGSTFGESQK